MSVKSLTLGANAVRTAEDYVNLRGYQNIVQTSFGSGRREYSDEKTFWKDALDRRRAAAAGSRVLLRKFVLSDWLPRVPGLYWKEGSAHLRAGANQHRMDHAEALAIKSTGSSHQVYFPVGKSMHILGGVGNVRLLPTASGGQMICASSSGDYWQGVPVLLTASVWQTLGGVPTARRADVEGVWTPMPRDAAQALGGEAGIPRFCVVVNRRQDIKVYPQLSPGTSSAWTLFERRDPETNLVRYDFAYSTFHVGPGGQNEPNDNWATEWVEDYVRQFNGKPLTDYDEQMPRFDASLPINELMSREVDLGRLRAFVDRVKESVLSSNSVRYDSLSSVLMTNFDLEEIRILALDYLNLRVEDLIGPGEGKATAVERLLAYCEQQRRLSDIVTGVLHERPDLTELLAA